MQNTETDKKTNGDEGSIHFRPSPNFKHMKKFLKSKFEENQNEVSECNDIKVNMSRVVNKVLEVNEEKKVKAMIQPPLPPNPPPPDSPPLVTPKQEIENDGYEDVAGSSESQGNELTSECKTNIDETLVKSEKVEMCRDFIRGTCVKREGCRFTHKLILSQLPGVYIFCKNFQNSVCLRPKCNYVHATVFEKEHFLRTGYLPQHVFKHLKETPPAQPPLPQEGLQASQMPQIPANYTKPPLPTQLHVTQLPTLQPYANNVTARNGTDLFRPTLPNSNTIKRNWNDTDDSSRSPCDSDATVPLAKKCKTCDSTEFRYQYNKNKVEKLKQSTLELNQEILQLNKKQQRLNTVLIKLFESMKSKSSINVLQSSLDINGDKDENLLGSNFSLTDFLTTLLLNSGDTNIPTDSL